MSIKYKTIEKVNPRDPKAPKKSYASAVHETTVKMKGLAKGLAAKSTTASEGDVYSVLIGLRDLIVEHLERGDRVTIEGIGSFAVNLSSEGSDKPEDFHPGLIRKKKVVYTSDSEMKDNVSRMKVEKYVSKENKK